MLQKIIISALLVIVLLALPSKAYAAATFSVDPTSGSYTAGDTIDVNIILDTGLEDTIGADAIILFDSAKLEVSDASLGSLFGTKVTDGTVSYGKIIFEAVALGSGIFNGVDTYATITFNAIADGDANVDIKFTAIGDTTDSNVTANDVSGTDLLNQVNNGILTILEATTTTTTTLSTPSATTTKTAVPVSGHVENTIAMFISGIVLISTGFFLRKRYSFHS